MSQDLNIGDTEIYVFLKETIEEDCHTDYICLIFRRRIIINNLLLNEAEYHPKNYGD